MRASIALVFLLESVALLQPASTSAQGISPRMVLPIGHSGSITSIDFAPDGTQFVTASNDGTLKVWDFATGREISTIKVFERKIEEMDKSLAKFTAAGAQLLTSNKLGDKVSLINVQTGEEINSVTDSWVNSISIDATRKRFLSASLTGVIIWDSNTFKKVLTVAKASADDIIAKKAPSVEAATFSPDGKLVGVILSEMSRAYSVAIYDAATGKKLAAVTLDDSQIDEIVFSPDGKSLVVAGQLQLIVFNLTSQTIVHTHQTYSKSSIAFADNGETLVCVPQRDQPFRLNLKDKSVQEFGRRPGRLIYSTMTLSTDRKFMALACSNVNGNQYDTKVEIWDLARNALVRTIEDKSSVVTTATVSPTNRYIATGHQKEGVKLWDTFSGSLGNVWDDQEDSEKIVFSPDEKYVAIQTPEGIRLLDRTTDSMRLNLYGSRFKFGGFGKGGNIWIGSRQKISSVNPRVGYKSIQTGEPVVDTHFEDIEELRMVSQDSFFLIRTSSGVRLYDQKGKAMAKITPDIYKMNSADISADRKLLAVGGGFTEGQILCYDSKTGEVVRTLKGQSQPVTMVRFSNKGRWLASASEDKSIWLWNLGATSGNVSRRLIGHGDAVRSISFSKDDRFLITGSEDRTFRLWDLQTNKELTTVATSGREFIMRTPEGYYMASKDGAKTVHFVQNGKVYFFDQFDLQYNRPDLVLEKIGIAPREIIDAYKKAYEKRIKKMGFNVDQFEQERSFNVPVIKTTRPGVAIEEVKNKRYEVILEGSDNLFNLNRINVLVNGVPVYGINGLTVATEKSKVVKKKLAFDLSTGMNTIQISVLNEKGVESLAERFDVRYSGTNKTPALYVIAVGTSKYRDERKNLNYAAKDAKDVADFFRSAGHYSQVFSHTLVDEDVTRQRILKIKEQLMKTDVDDHVVFFLAGHGVFDKDLNYYLATHDMDFTAPEKNGLLYDELEFILDGIPARNKVLLIDACHSGEIDKEEIELAATNNTERKAVTFRSVGDKSVRQKHVGFDNSFEVMKMLFTDLRKTSGCTVISAAGGAEYALEDALWNNGVFTFALLRGLKEKKADANRDGTIMLSELQRYLYDEVPNLTSGKQRPTSRVENLSNDIRIR